MSMSDRRKTPARARIPSKQTLTQVNNVPLLKRWMVGTPRMRKEVYGGNWRKRDTASEGGEQTDHDIHRRQNGSFVDKTRYKR